MKFCKRGHDTAIYGRRDSNGQCRECARIDSRAHRRGLPGGMAVLPPLHKYPVAGRPRERFCKRGHDTDETGRRVNGCCKVCASDREQAARLRKRTRRREVKGLPPLLPGDEDVTYEQLPFPDLERWIRTHQIQVERAFPAGTRRAYQRYKQRGTTVPLLWADRVACDILGVHPLYIWGIETYLGAAA